MVCRHPEGRPSGFRDRVIGNDGVKLAALALAHGLDPMRVLDCRDPIEMLALDVTVEEAARLAGQARQDQANRIVKAVLGDG